MGFIIKLSERGNTGNYKNCYLVGKDANEKSPHIIIDKSYLDKAKQIEKKYGNINDLNKALGKIFDYPSMFCEINYSDIYEIKIKED